MSILLEKYPVFENNQVLTSTQLNELAAYLDQQTRLSRYRLIGIGTVCGLNPSYDTTNNTLSITAGTGITSEGYLMETGACAFTKYRAYTLPLSVDYPPFINTATTLQVPLWELLPSNYTPLPTETVQNLDFNFVNGLTPGQKKIVLLYAERVDVEADACLGKSCDTLGAERTFTLRKLLVSIDDLQIIISNTGSTDLTYTAKFDLPDLLSTRPLFNPGLGHSRDYFQFQQNFRNSAASVYKRVPADAKDLLNVLRQTYTIFQPILGDVYNNVNPFLDNQIPNLNIWNKIMDGINDTSGPAYFGIQYFYDFLRDLLLAYNEFRDAAFELLSDCCLGTNLFPMHLLLGEAIVVDPDRPSQYRNHFVGIPLTPEQRAAKDTLIAYHVRMVLMVRMFDVAVVHNPNPSSPPTTVTRITPSFEKWGKLSERSIPFYYMIDTVDPLLGKLERVWNYKNVLRNKDRGGEYPVVAYGNQSANQSAPIDPIQTPLYYDQDQFTFLRIEGHLRKSYTTVLSELNALKNDFDLPFNVVAVRLQGTSTPAEIMARCNFNDLRSQYTAQRNEFLCKMNRFFNHFFEIDAAGVYQVKNPPRFVQILFSQVQTPTGGGNSSAAFLPAYFTLPGQQSLRFAQPFQYAPLAPSDLLSQANSWLGQLMTSLIPICQTQVLLPEELADFDYGADTTDTSSSFILTYIEAISQANVVKALTNILNDEIMRSTRNRFPPEFYFAYTNWIQEQFYFLNEFISDCQYRVLEAIFYTLRYRVGYLQTNDPGLFSNFITRHPGPDHKAGVTYGGTFVVVYPGTPLNFTVKTREVFAQIAQDIKVLEVKKAILRSTRGRSIAQNAELQLVEAQLCDLYAQQVSTPGRPFTAGTAISAVSIRRIAIREDDVIADFCLPYLTNCECECDDIPAPTTEDLHLPAIAMPSFYEYQLGDYAFTKDFATQTTGCTSPAQVVIDVRPFVNYDQALSREVSFVLKFVTDGATPITTFDPKARAIATMTTAKGGTVLISYGASNFQQFTYTPPRNFLGIDTFQYAFELYSASGSIIARSNICTITVNVVAKCSGKNVGVTETQVSSTAQPAPAIG